MSNIIINPGTDVNQWTLTGAPVDYAILGAVEVKEEKNFISTTSAPISFSAPPGETITAILNCTATIWPGSIQIVDISGTFYVEFNTTISITVQYASGLVALLQQTLVAQGLLGPVGTVIPSTSPITPPTVTCVGAAITGGGTGVQGSIQIGAFFVDVLELKSVKVALDPTSPIGPPLI